MIPLSSGDSGIPRGDSAPFIIGMEISAWTASECKGALPSGMVSLSTSGWIMSCL
jgi:hypothetical protein